MFWPQENGFSLNEGQQDIQNYGQNVATPEQVVDKNTVEASFSSDPAGNEVYASIDSGDDDNHHDADRS